MCARLLEAWGSPASAGRFDPTGAGRGSPGAALRVGAIFSLSFLWESCWALAPLPCPPARDSFVGGVGGFAFLASSGAPPGRWCRMGCLRETSRPSGPVMRSSSCSWRCLNRCAQASNSHPAGEVSVTALARPPPPLIARDRSSGRLHGGRRAGGCLGGCILAALPQQFVRPSSVQDFLGTRF